MEDDRMASGRGVFRASAALLLIGLTLIASSLVVADGQVAVQSTDEFGCSTKANFAHVSPILCPVAKIRLCWNVTEDRELLLRAEAKVTGYIQVGLMDRNLVGFVDVVTMFIDDDATPRAIDQFIGGFASWTHADLETDGSQDVEVVDGAVKTYSSTSSDGHVAGTYTSVTVKRKLVHDDDGTSNLYSSQKDYMISRGTETGVIWMTSKTQKPTVDGGTVTVPTYGYKYPNGNKGTWRVTFDDSEEQLTCTYYCKLQMNVCGDSQEKESQYKTESECVARCSQYIGDGTWTLGNIQQDHDTQTLACRINAAHQAENAPASDDALRQSLCDNSGVTGGGVCGTYCQNYCTHAVTQCSGMWKDNAECLSECASMGTGSSGPVVIDARYGSANFPFTTLPPAEPFRPPWLTMPSLTEPCRAK